MATLVDQLVAAIAQNESVRRGGVALALSPLAMLLSGALKDQHSDHLAFAMQAVNNPWVLLADRLVYWPQFVLSWVWSLDLAVRLDSLLRHFSLIFLALWVVELTRVAAGVQLRRLAITSVVFVGWWSMHWPEVGDSLYYSYAGIATLPFIALIGSPKRVLTTMSTTRAFVASMVGAMVAAAMNVLSLLVIVPLVLGLYVLRQGSAFKVSSHGRLGIRDVVGRNLLVGTAAGSLLALLRLTLSTNEDGGFTTFGLLEKIRTTRHLWHGSLYIYDNIRISLILLIVTAVIAVIRHNWPAVVLCASGATMVAGTVLITALEHVQANQLMPRYFSLTFALGLFVQVLSLVAVVPLPHINHQLHLGQRAAWLFGVLFVASTLFALRTPIEFGRDYKDQSGSSKQAVVMPASDIERVRTELLGKQPILVVANFWDVWPNSFLMQRAGLTVAAMENAPAYDVRQKGFADLLESESLTMLCLLRDDAEGDCVDLVEESFANHRLMPGTLTVLESWKIDGGTIAVMTSSRLG